MTDLITDGPTRGRRIGRPVGLLQAGNDPVEIVVLGCEVVADLSHEDMLSHAVVCKTKSGGHAALRSPAPCVDSEVDDSPLFGCSLLRRRLLGCCLLRRCSLLG